MPFAFAHLLGAWILGKGYEFITKKKINQYTWFFLLIGAIIPDLDFLFDWFLHSHLHRTVTHSLFFSVVSFITIYLTFWFLSDRKAKDFGFAIMVGVLIHVLFDSVSTKGIPLLWPLMQYFSLLTGIHGETVVPAMFAASPLILASRLKMALFDTSLGIAWIFYLWLRRKIKF